ncbi:unnamed protein product [Peniophora sp. CBMAI 1063]|nr:unnamed protein product [Peniophora sp. CBMAI 1063]
MPIRATITQFRAKLCRIKRDYRCQSFDTVKICRLLRDDLKLDPDGAEYLYVESLACAALASAVSDESDAQPAFEAFRLAVKQLKDRMDVEGIHKLEKAVQSASHRAVKDREALQKAQVVYDEAKRRADEAAEKERLANEAAAREAAARGTASRDTGSDATRKDNSTTSRCQLVDFAVAPSFPSPEFFDRPLPDPPSLNRFIAKLNLTVNPSITIPELLFRFQRKYRAAKLETHLFPLKFIKCPNFYAESALLNLNLTNAQPLRNEELRRAIADRMPIWVYGDRPGNAYQLERPSSPHSWPFGRVRSVSIVPPSIAGEQPIWVFRDLQGQLTPSHSIFRADFSPGHFERMSTGQRIYRNEDQQLWIGPIRTPREPCPEPSSAALLPPHQLLAAPDTSTSFQDHAGVLHHIIEEVDFAPRPSAPLFQEPLTASGRSPQLPELSDLPSPRLSGLTTLRSPSPLQGSSMQPAFPEPALAPSQLTHALGYQSPPTLPMPSPSIPPIERPPPHAGVGSSGARGVRLPPSILHGLPLPNVPAQYAVSPPISSSSAYSLSSASDTRVQPPSPPPSSTSSSSIASIPPLPALTRGSTSTLSDALDDESEVLSPVSAASPTLSAPGATTFGPMPHPAPSRTPPARELSPGPAPKKPAKVGVWSRVKSFYTSVFQAAAQETGQGNGQRMPGTLWG